MAKKEDKSDYAIGGGLLLGLGIGFFFLPNGLIFAGCIIGGLGAGLIITSIFATFRSKD